MTTQFKHVCDHQLWLNILALVILGCFASAALVPTFDIFLVAAENLGFDDGMHTYSMVAGLWGSMYAFGDFLGPIAGGFLLDQVGFQSLTTYTAYASFFMVALLTITMFAESKYCAAFCCCCNNKSMDKKGTASTGDNVSERTPLLTDSVGESDYLTTYPPQYTEATDTV